MCTTTTPNKGKAKIIVHGKSLRYNFLSSNLGCKVDNYLWKWKGKSSEKMKYTFEKLFQVTNEFTKKDHNTKVKKSVPVKIILINISFKEQNDRTKIILYLGN